MIPTKLGTANWGYTPGTVFNPPHKFGIQPSLFPWLSTKLDETGNNRVADMFAYAYLQRGTPYREEDEGADSGQINPLFSKTRPRPINQKHNFLVGQFLAIRGVIRPNPGGFAPFDSTGSSSGYRTQTITASGSVSDPVNNRSSSYQYTQTTRTDIVRKISWIESASGTATYTVTGVETHTLVGTYTKISDTRAEWGAHWVDGNNTEMPLLQIPYGPFSGSGWADWTGTGLVGGADSRTDTGTAIGREGSYTYNESLGEGFGYDAACEECASVMRGGFGGFLDSLKSFLDEEQVYFSSRGVIHYEAGAYIREGSEESRDAQKAGEETYCSQRLAELETEISDLESQAGTLSSAATIICANNQAYRLLWANYLQNTTLGSDIAKSLSLRGVLNAQTSRLLQKQIELFTGPPDEELSNEIALQETIVAECKEAASAFDASMPDWQLPEFSAEVLPVALSHLYGDKIAERAILKARLATANNSAGFGAGGSLGPFDIPGPFASTAKGNEAPMPWREETVSYKPFAVVPIVWTSGHTPESIGNSDLQSAYHECTFSTTTGDRHYSWGDWKVMFPGSSIVRKNNPLNAASADFLQDYAFTHPDSLSGVFTGEWMEGAPGTNEGIMIGAMVDSNFHRADRAGMSKVPVPYGGFYARKRSVSRLTASNHPAMPPFVGEYNALDHMCKKLTLRFLRPSTRTLKPKDVTATLTLSQDPTKYWPVLTQTNFDKLPLWGIMRSHGVIAFWSGYIDGTSPYDESRITFLDQRGIESLWPLGAFTFYPLSSENEPGTKNKPYGSVDSYNAYFRRYVGESRNALGESEPIWQDVSMYLSDLFTVPQTTSESWISNDDFIYLDVASHIFSAGRYELQQTANLNYNSSDQGLQYAAPQMPNLNLKVVYKRISVDLRDFVSEELERHTAMLLDFSEPEFELSPANHSIEYLTLGESISWQSAVCVVGGEANAI